MLAARWFCPACWFVASSVASWSATVPYPAGCLLTKAPYPPTAITMNSVTSPNMPKTFLMALSPALLQSRRRGRLLTLLGTPSPPSRRLSAYEPILHLSPGRLFPDCPKQEWSTQDKRLKAAPKPLLAHLYQIFMVSSERKKLGDCADAWRYSYLFGSTPRPAASLRI